MFLIPCVTGDEVSGIRDRVQSTVGQAKGTMGTQTKLGEPCELADSRLIFTTYDYIRPPQFGWYNDAGENITVKGKAGLYDAHMRVMDAPAGIRIVAQTARHPDQPYVVEPEHPWEADGLHLGKTFIFDKDDGYYKVWGTATSNGKALPCYLQSRDFETWERPDLGLATWEKGRMIAVEARDLGQFTTTAIMPPGRKILINALTMRGAGSIRVEVATAPDFSQRVTVPGRSFEDCIPINGDAYRTTVKWKDGDDIGVVDGTPISLRFKLEQAQLFFADFE